MLDALLKVRLEAAHKAELERRAAEIGRSPSWLVRLAIVNLLETWQTDKRKEPRVH